MRHDRLVRAALAIAAVFAAAAIVFAMRGTSPPPESQAARAAAGPTAASADGGAYFGDRCGRCHDAGDFAGWAARHPDAYGRGQWLERVLASHHAPPEEERALILGYIQQAIAAGDR